MFRTMGALAAGCLVASSAAAASSSTATRLDCSDGLSVSLADTAMLSCTGSFLLGSGSITSDSTIVIRAGGALVLEDISLTAPVIELFSHSGVLSFGQGVSLRAGALLAGVGPGVSPSVTVSSAGTLSVGGDGAVRPVDAAQIVQAIQLGHSTPLPGRSLSPVTPVPEPAAFLTLLAGLWVLSGFTRQRRHGPTG